jgi:tRNA A37 threonylcarbamoyladenosine synthetase subunit TsaC/SUA5/YrdC
MPNLDFTLRLLRQTGPLATTSANLSGGPNPTTVGDVSDQLGDRPNLILDGGPTPGLIASTVLDLTGPEIKVLRQGPISLEAIQSHLARQ